MSYNQEPKESKEDYVSIGYSQPRVYRTLKSKSDNFEEKKDLFLAEVDRKLLGFDHKADYSPESVHFWL
jgi:hypothetical protein